MRLLEIKGPGEFSLVQVATHNTLPYAILSHTWTSQEVTYQDLISGAGKNKSGYEKIKFCGEQATRDGLRYFWVDTCCIDKSNSTKPLTAINSMFRWYRNAMKCYVYLTDVLVPELIAPAIVEFFSKEHTRLGDKQSLKKLVYKITQILIQALQGNPFSDFSIAERKGWAAQRQTTKEEDQVYCLLGLCEVSMPPIYGEGKAAALKRLQMTIKEFSNDSSKPKDLEDNIVPFILAEVEEKLSVRGRTTKLVLELVYRMRDRYRNCLVIWIPVTNMKSLHQAYQDIARQLKIPGLEEDKADTKKLVQGYLSMESIGRWLLVFDNADDVNMWITQSWTGPGSGRLIDYLPRSEQGCIVFTTRNRKTAVKLVYQNVVEVPEMNEDLTYLLLAITQAAAYINEIGIAFVDYLSLLTDQEEAVIDLLSEQFEDDRRYDNIKNPIATTWLISFEQIRHRDPLAADYLSFMACPSRKKVMDAIGTLDAYSFIIKRSADLAFDLHRLRAITRLEEVFPDDDHQNRSVWRIYLPHIRYALISNIIDRDAPNRTKLAWRFGMCLYSDGRYNEAEGQFVEGFATNTLTSMANLASTYRNQGRWKEAEDLFVLVMETSLRVLGQEHPNTLTSMANLAFTWRAQRQAKDAFKLMAECVTLRTRIIGTNHPDTLSSCAILLEWQTEELEISAPIN
ncbi:heterokaryon incompatibility protein-domain-containing protein [Halenospora varia]|nr:heterokaryon incompatibility protein-domain-containing protein [Halenospora varia]